MTVLETVLVFVGIPLGVFGLVAVLVYGASARGFPRYRPGRSFNVAPVWFLAAPPTADRSASGRPALTSGRPALTSGRGTAESIGAAPSDAVEHTGPKGGACGSW